MIIAGLLTGTVHRIVEETLCERLKPCSLPLAHPFRADAHDEVAGGFACRHPPCRHDI